MKLPMSWLKEYVDIDCDLKTFCDKMTLSGSKVECVENRGDAISNVVVGKVLSIEKHPDADKLVVVQTDVGEIEPIQIVTGATNLYVGAYVPVALHKATLYGGLKIKKSKIRGVTSNGMFCSVEEFGFTRADFPEAPENGIYIFQDEQKLGDCVKKILQIDEDVVEFEITSNRADCFSIIGLAREVSATFNVPLNLPKITFDGKDESVCNLDIKIENKDLCKRYTCRIIKDITVKSSPKWLRHRLSSAGIRPINNIVDIANYVMLELGQPMHAYDFEKLQGNILTVRNAKNNETLTTLDGVERTLSGDVLVIQDEKNVVDLAGIIGGKNSMIDENTKTILLESASFDGAYIRSASKKLGLRTDASSKYEKGLDENLCIIALDRACMLINMLNCGKVLKNTVDIYTDKKENWNLCYDSEKINKLLGTNISSQNMIDILASLQIKSDGNTAIIPTFRQDLQTETDIAEEIARLYGYDNILPTLSSGSTVGKLTYEQQIIENITNSMINNGLNQSLSYSFESPKVFEKLNIEKNSTLRQTVSISNPLGEDFSIMRTSTINAMLNNLSINYNRRNKQAHLFEIGKIYLPKELPLKELPIEKNMLTIGMYGDVDFYDIKGIAHNLLSSLGINNAQYIPFETLPFMHPYKTASINIRNERINIHTDANCEIGYIGEVNPQILENYDIGTKTYIGVLCIDTLVNLANFDKKYKPLPKYPAIQRDIAVLIKDEIPVDKIEHIIKLKGGNFLENITLFDIYKGKQIEKGYKSVAYNISFRSPDKTLVEEDVNTPIKNILTELESSLDAKLRDK